MFLNSSLLFVVLFYVFPPKVLTESFFGGVLCIDYSGISVRTEAELAEPA